MPAKRKNKGLSVGTRVKHASDTNLIEGVIVWNHECINTCQKDFDKYSMKGKEWSVHWSNGERGIYKTDEICKIQPKNIKELVDKEIKADEVEEKQDIEEDAQV